MGARTTKNLKDSNETTHHFKINIILTGSSSVGKSSILSRYMDDVFNDSYSLENNTKIKTIHHNEQIGRLQILDMAINPRFKVFDPTHYYHADRVIVLYDVTDLQSFEFSKELVEKMCKCVHGKEWILVLVGNKCDMWKLKGKLVLKRVRSLLICYK
eukprot:TRINITY_DN11279_c0_g1_i1.p1 TRINITY_DN11279_c0_g1~~TRINITY_DN11279_c0_g1_i1.p1  ORF type:complete len:171 (-),score=38.18 TRINITY_DN11279_c0_g1_i1:86-556(-)